ncbi:hypothetical protein SEA_DUMPSTERDUDE_65 [Gordonia phage DumpsterDude]|uniref:Helix-turn-helix DNA binding domain protein n=1 Tax=Gordonia phage DumpsterDude TaxID=2713262 RepID=A0A6G8R0E3_9CAUD|nr:transcriptional regulator WhiB-like [Gordonia phage DumpsterDude]QIN93653.1 hypothetical protein SEA_DUMPSTERDUDE_65 [Gordonia phage DumpsterDude]
MADQITTARRQIRVGDLAAEGYRPHDIARQVGCSLRTVHTDLDAMGFELPTRHHKACGTTNGYRHHHKLGEKPCDACRNVKRKARGR